MNYISMGLLDYQSALVQTMVWCWIDDKLLPEPIMTGINDEYRQFSNIRCTQSQNINVSRLVLQLSLPNQLKPSVKLRVKMKLEQRRQVMLQLHLSDQRFYCLLWCILYYRLYGICNVSLGLNVLFTEEYFHHLIFYSKFSTEIPQGTSKLWNRNGVFTSKWMQMEKQMMA